ncbi:hypothetical protein [Candidatus Viridilinea mediisalina]|uniref:Uncharacterized protein n=1 Tax=Candidatus Viridilinea mediisalina TaxID=2024553 RepID=A0A2A6RJ16_9CHLR|nr:hypothetical protein [Candidatus Viridilinea mediisalina]PDW02943.1 hypothetical protein CJ255_11505 [Candidatus Viridilinea mediisalina]
MSEHVKPSAYESLRTAILGLFHETLSRYPPSYAPGGEPQSEPPHRLGEYLVYQGYLSPRELHAALQASKGDAKNKPKPLGVILVTNYNLPAAVLTMALLLQTLDHLAHTPKLPPRFLGEQLLRDAALTPQQLALVLEEQVVDYAQGHWRRIGDLIANHGWLDAETLTKFVREMHG